VISLPEVDYGPDMIWYAAYGSNLKKDRFLCYIRGGQPEGRSEPQIGMEDKSLPKKDVPFIIPHELYFAGASSRWHGGVAFISPKSSTKSETLCRIYLIKRQQFVELIAQENQVSNKEVKIDFERLNTQMRETACSGWYGEVLKVGQRAGRPIYTFSSSDSKQQKHTRPSEAYLKTIIMGLVECWSQKKKVDLANYIHSATQGAYNREDIKRYLKDCEKEYVEKQRTSKDLFRVEPTDCREGNAREFIAQLSRRSREILQVKPPETLVLSSVHNGREFKILARLNKADEEFENHVIHIDQKLRMAIGAAIGDWIRVRKVKKEEKSRFSTFWEKQIGTQPELMRVYRASFEDMEIPIARIPASIFEVIGTDPGRFILIQSTKKAVRVRAGVLSSEVWDKRMELITSEKANNPNPRKILSLDRLRDASTGNDLPPIFIDLEMRNKLGVDLNDCVRVVRDVRDSFLSKIHLAALPIMFAAIGFAMSLKIDNLTKILIIMIGMLLSMLALYEEVRSKIT
jgi:hypothetical protein